jgi:hypothetical protein
MNLRQRTTLATGLQRNTDRPALPSRPRDPLACVSAIAITAALLFLFAAIEYRDQLTEARECVRTHQ